MANEITVSAGLTISRSMSGSPTAALSGSSSSAATLLDSSMAGGTQSFTTSAAAVSIVTSAGYAFIKNTNATGNLLLYTDSGATQRLATLKPGEGISIPAPAAMWGVASTGTVIAHVVSAKA